MKPRYDRNRAATPCDFTTRVPVPAPLATRARYALLAIATASLFAAAGACDMSGMHGGRDTSRGSQVQGGMAAAVTISDFSFEPGNLRVPVGATVTWTNEDSAPHDATARGADWKTDRLSDADSDTLTFDEPGDYDYYCSIHPNMKARLVVR